MATACGLALATAACREDDGGGQRIAVPDPTPAALLPDALALPYAEAAPVQWAGADTGYRWAEQAYGLERSVYDAPPDYAFDYGGVQPWAWETGDDYAMYAEPWDEGYRYYYYEPGAAYPYFVRDGSYGYGFDPTGVLVALIDRDGDYLPAERFYEAAPLAGRYYMQGRDLRNAAVRGRRIPVQEEAWVQQAPRVRAASEPWLRAARTDERWRNWRNREDRREGQAIAGQQVARLEPQRIPQDGRWDAPREVQVRRDLARAQREELRAQREQARGQARAEARAEARAQAEQVQRAQAEQRRARRESAQRAQAEQRRAQREQARAAEHHARQAAAQAHSQDRGPGGGGPERQAKPDRPQHQDHGGGPKPDRGGQGGGGKGGGDKGDRGGGKKD